MLDLLVVAIIVVFFLACAALVRGSARIIAERHEDERGTGSIQDERPDTDAGESRDEPAASKPSRGAGR
jgi:hypothetical protein